MTIYAAADYFTCVIESVMMFMLYGTFLRKRESLPRWVYAAGAALLALLITISNKFSGNGILNAVGVPVSYFAVSFLYRGNTKTRAVISVLNFLLTAIVEIMALYMIVLICRVTVAEVVGTPTYRVLGIIISKTVNMMIINVIRLKYKKKQIMFSASYWLLFLLMFATSTVAVFLIFELSYSISLKYMYDLSVLCSFGLLFSTFFALYLYEHLAQQAETIYGQKQYEEHLRSQIRHLDDIVAAQRELKKFRHDFSHCLIGLKGYIDDGRYDEAEKYLDGLCETFAKSKKVTDTGNTALDAVIGTKKAIAEGKNIVFNTKIQIPESLRADAVDLCVIFGNALDNAIEAAEKMPEGERKISLTVICQDERLFCRITNSSPDREVTRLETGKKDRGNHGFGVENIKATLAKYGSEPEFDYSDHVFGLKFVIFLEK